MNSFQTVVLIVSGSIPCACFDIDFCRVLISFLQIFARGSGSLLQRGQIRENAAQERASLVGKERGELIKSASSLKDRVEGILVDK